MKALLGIIAVLLALHLANAYFQNPPRAEADGGLAYSTMFQCGVRENNKSLLEAMGDLQKFANGKRVVGFSAFSDLLSASGVETRAQICFAVMIQK